MSTNTWNRLVLVVDTDKTTNTVQAYVNGVLAASFNLSSVSRLRLSANSDAFFFADDGSENRPIDVATIGMWGRALSSDEVFTLGGLGDDGILASAYFNPLAASIEYTASAATALATAPAVSVAVPSQIQLGSENTFSLTAGDGMPTVLAGLPDLRSLVTDRGWTFNRAGATPELWTTNLEIGGSVDRSNNYTGLGSGWMSVSQTGSYMFWVAADDAVTFRIRDEAGGVIAVARDNNSDGGTNWQSTRNVNNNDPKWVLNTGAVYLESGKYYKFEAVLTEGTATDYFRIGYTSTSLPPGRYVANVVGSSENYPPLSGNTNLEMAINAFDGTTAKYLSVDSFGNSANSVVSRADPGQFPERWRYTGMEPHALYALRI